MRQLRHLKKTLLVATLIIIFAVSLSCRTELVEVNRWAYKFYYDIYPIHKHIRYERYKEKLLLESPASNPETIFFGDSILAGLNVSKLSLNQETENLAIPGETAASLLLWLPNNKIRDPKIIYIALGINDVRRMTSRQQVRTDFEKLIERLDSGSAQVIVQSVLVTSSPITNIEVDWINNELRSMTINLDSVVWFDANKALKLESNLDSSITYDGVHLNKNGYQLYGASVAAMLTNQLRSTQNFVSEEIKNSN